MLTQAVSKLNLSSSLQGQNRSRSRSVRRGGDFVINQLQEEDGLVEHALTPRLDVSKDQIDRADGFGKVNNTYTSIKTTQEPVMRKRPPPRAASKQGKAIIAQ